MGPLGPQPLHGNSCLERMAHGGHTTVGRLAKPAGRTPGLLGKPAYCLDAIRTTTALMASNDPADLIHDECPRISEHGHVRERERRPAPAARLAPDDRQRRDALAAQ